LDKPEEELRQNYDEMSKSQQELRLSEQRYRDVIEDQTEFICRFTPTGKLTFVNEAYCRYFGLDKESCLGSPHTVVIPPDDLYLMKHHLSTLSPENPIGILEHRIIMPSGEMRWQRWSDRAIFDADGHIVEYQSVGRDTTERMETEAKLKSTNEELYTAYEQLTATEEELRQNYTEMSKSQQELRLSEERYRNVVEDQTEFISRFRPDGTHVFVNEAYCRYFGVTREEIIGKKFAPRIPAEDRSAVTEHFVSLTKAHPVGEIRHRIIMSSGEVRWQRWSDRAIFDPDGKIIEYQSVGRDISDIIKAEEAMRESEERYSALFHKNHSVSLLIDTGSGIMVDANAAACAYYRYRYEQITKMRIFEINRLDKEKVLHDLDRAKNQKERHFPSTHYLANGEQHSVEVYSGPIRVKGKLLLYSIIHDITDRKRAEQALRDSENKLSAILRGSPIPQFVIDKDHKILQWNTALEWYSGIKADEVIGTNQQWRAFYPQERPCMVDLIVERQIEKIPQWYSGKHTKSSLIEDAYEATDFFPHIGKSGTWLHFTAAPIRDSLGAIIGAVETLEDVTGRKRRMKRGKG